MRGALKQPLPFPLGWGVSGVIEARRIFVGSHGRNVQILAFPRRMAARGVRPRSWGPAEGAGSL